MSNTLINYLNKRLQEETMKPLLFKPPGPVITISREVGCNGIMMAGLLADKLNRLYEGTNWKILSKEVFLESARELNLHPEKVKKYFKQTDKYALDDIFKAFSSKYFKSERRIIRTVTDIVHSFASDGYCILVGRAGHIIARDIKNALHLRLFAPMEYRILSIMQKKQLTRMEAIEFIESVEKERIAFRKALGADNLHEELFDLSINRISYSDEDTVELICAAIEKKKIMSDYTVRIQFY